MNTYYFSEVGTVVLMVPMYIVHGPIYTVHDIT